MYDLIVDAIGAIDNSVLGSWVIKRGPGDAIFFSVNAGSGHFIALKPRFFTNNIKKTSKKNQSLCQTDFRAACDIFPN